jgi:hypothetical protein
MARSTDGGGRLRYIRAVVPVVLLTLLAACNQGEEYPRQVVENFMGACTAQPGATEEACSCAIERIQEEMTLEEFVRFEARLEEGGQPPPEIQEIVQECATG